MSSLKDVSPKDVGLKDVSLKDVVVPILCCCFLVIVSALPRNGHSLFQLRPGQQLDRDGPNFGRVHLGVATPAGL